jgi:hypothetical protein
MDPIERYARRAVYILIGASLIAGAGIALAVSALIK